MSKNSYFPTVEAEQIIWLSHYSSKLPINGPICGIDGNEITRTQTDITTQIFILQQWHPSSQLDAKEATAHKQLILNGTGNEPVPYPQPTLFPNPPPASIPGIQKRLFSQIVRIKASLNYTEAIGKDLGIVGTPTTIDHPIPEYSLSVELSTNGPCVRIDFNKYRHDGIWIESRTDGGEWGFLGVDTIKPYLDERPLAPGNTHETREYRLRWWDKSIAHGEWTGIQKAVLGL